MTIKQPVDVIAATLKATGAVYPRAGAALILSDLAKAEYELMYMGGDDENS